jgi:signal transduction histidine kinase
MLGSQLERLDELSRRGLEDVRRSLKELRPDMLERNILSDALTKLVDEINNCSNRNIELRISAPMDNLNPSLQETVYRIVQESITNSVRHGNAQRIIVSIDSDNGALFLRIKDDGIGCSRVNEGFGLHYMRERILEKDGFVEIETQPGKGFEISAYIPNAGDRFHD